MKVEQIYTGCLAEAAYYIESDGEAAIIDPLRDSAPYLDRANRDKAKIKYVFETHFHADFVSGHIELAQKTGATIVYGPTAKPAYNAHIAEDGEVFKIGKVSVRLLHTPGHTLESSCYLLIDEQGKEVALFSGDTLFINDVGRPDLAQHVIAELTQEKLAAHLFDSLRNKILPLNDDIIIYPNHGAGSACGKNMSNETTDTLGHQKKVNYALNPNLSKEQFIKDVLTGLVPPPGYFPYNVLMNLKGYESLDKVVSRAVKALNVEEFEVVFQETSALLLDTRNAEDFARGFVPGAINIGLNGQFASWVGTLIPDLKQAILLISDKGKEEEAVLRMARVGYDNCIGFLEGGFESWAKAGKGIDTVETISAEAFAQLHKSQPDMALIDVRKKSEYDSEHIIGAENMPLNFLNNYMAQINPDKTYYVHCAGGYRSMIAVSILKARGYSRLIDIRGGFNAIKATGKVKISQYVCPTTML
jgi:glyoxylase-like metal-dependent hydrolase (beta-lactamase superfamily II)/rhodanese-related sulfurtransferase